MPKASVLVRPPGQSGSRSERRVKPGHPPQSPYQPVRTLDGWGRQLPGLSRSELRGRDARQPRSQRAGASAAAWPKQPPIPALDCTPGQREHFTASLRPHCSAGPARRHSLGAPPARPPRSRPKRATRSRPQHALHRCAVSAILQPVPMPRRDHPNGQPCRRPSIALCAVVDSALPLVVGFEMAPRRINALSNEREMPRHLVLETPRTRRKSWNPHGPGDDAHLELHSPRRGRMEIECNRRS
jgi:hypothetical protein